MRHAIWYVGVFRATRMSRCTSSFEHLTSAGHRVRMRSMTSGMAFTRTDGIEAEICVRFRLRDRRRCANSSRIMRWANPGGVDTKDGVGRWISMTGPRPGQDDEWLMCANGAVCACNRLKHVAFSELKRPPRLGSFGCGEVFGELKLAGRATPFSGSTSAMD